MLQVRDVVKTYDGRAVVNRVSFDVEAGEIFALLGPNGAGKTTLIRMITDILKPDSGTISLDGHKVTDAKRPEIAYLPDAVKELAKRAGLTEARVVVYHRPREWRENLYSSSAVPEPRFERSGGAAALRGALPEPTFLYLWSPGL